MILIYLSNCQDFNNHLLRAQRGSLWIELQIRMKNSFLSIYPSTNPNMLKGSYPQLVCTTREGHPEKDKASSFYAMAVSLLNNQGLSSFLYAINCYDLISGTLCRRVYINCYEQIKCFETRFIKGFYRLLEGKKVTQMWSDFPELLAPSLLPIRPKEVNPTSFFESHILLRIQQSCRRCIRWH